MITPPTRLPRRRKHLLAALTSQRETIRDLTEQNAALRGEAKAARRELEQAQEGHREVVADRNAARGRIELARQALIADGYFTADEIGEDIAPRIVELREHTGRYVKGLQEDLVAASAEIERLTGELAKKAAANERLNATLAAMTRPGPEIPPAGDGYPADTCDGKPIAAAGNGTEPATERARTTRSARTPRATGTRKGPAAQKAPRDAGGDVA